MNLIDAFIDEILKIKEENEYWQKEERECSNVAYVERSNNKLKAEIEELKAEIKQAVKLRDEFGQECDDNKKNVDILKAENKRLKDELQAVNDDYNNDHKVHNDYADGLLAEIKTLQNKIEGLKSSDDVRKLRISRLKNEKLNAENEDLLKACKLLKDTSHYPKEYEHEAEEYFSCNDKSKGVLFFMIDKAEFKADGGRDETLYADECMAEIDNV
jgi:chromosome segregation ATPase